MSSNLLSLPDEGRTGMVVIRQEVKASCSLPRSHPPRGTGAEAGPAPCSRNGISRHWDTRKLTY